MSWRRRKREKKLRCCCARDDDIRAANSATIYLRKSKHNIENRLANFVVTIYFISMLVARSANVLSFCSFAVRRCFFWREFSCKHQRDALDILQQCVLFSSSSTFDNSLVRMTREHIFAIRAMHIHTVTLGDGFSLLFSIPFPSRDVKRFRHFIVHTHKNTTMEKSTHTRTERVK